MKDTTKTNESIFLINKAIARIKLYYDFYDEPYICTHPTDDIEELKDLNKQISRINIGDIKQEMTESCEDYSKAHFIKNLFEFKFENLLSWKYSHTQSVEEEDMQYTSLFSEFANIQTKFGIDTYQSEYIQLRHQFIFLCHRITELKYTIEKALHEFEVIGNLYLESINQPLTNVKTKRGNATPKQSTYRIASKRKTDVIKILSAMYDCGMFVNTDGKTATNKQELMEAFGGFLGEDFKAYSSLLSQAKERDPHVFYKPFDDIKKAITAYYTAEK